MKIIWAAHTLFASIFFASEQAKKDFRYNRCRNARLGKILFLITWFVEQEIQLVEKRIAYTRIDFHTLHFHFQQLWTLILLNHLWVFQSAISFFVI